MTRMLPPFALLLVATACPRSNPEPRPTDPPMSDENHKARMQRHFEDASAMKEAVIDGDLETLVERAQWVVEHEAPADYPVAWQPHVVQLVEAARGAGAATDVTAAAARTADLAGNCGRCHRAVGAQPTFEDPMAPMGDESVMARHQWAADRMWEGIIGPSEHAWTRGTAEFAAVPGCAVDPEAPLSEYMGELCTKIGALGAKAASAKSLDDRVRTYGAFLETCAACHNAGA